ncbi:MAG: DedA family protein [Bacilli bacterium]
MDQFIAFILEWGYIILLPLFCLEMIGIPMPGESILLFVGVKLTHSIWDAVAMICSVSLGTTLGSVSAYWIGLTFAHTILDKWGPKIGLTEERMKHFEKLSNKYRIPLLIFSKFLPGIRVISNYYFGIQRASFFEFIFYTFLGSFLWSSTYILFGSTLFELWKNYGIWSVYLSVGIVIFVGLSIFFMRKNRSKAQS